MEAETSWKTFCASVAIPLHGEIFPQRDRMFETNSSKFPSRVVSICKEKEFSANGSSIPLGKYEFTILQSILRIYVNE